MKGYTNKASIENYCLEVISESFDSQINDWIGAIEEYIDNYTGRNFVIADLETPTERKYDGNGENELLIDDCMLIESITIDDEELLEADYYTYPANTDRKYRIINANGVFTRGRQNIVIEACWGYSATVPADIKLAATVLVAGIMQHADLTGKEARSESIGSYSISYDSDKGWNDFARVKEILNSYIKYTF